MSTFKPFRAKIVATNEQLSDIGISCLNPGDVVTVQRPASSLGVYPVCRDDEGRVWLMDVEHLEEIQEEECATGVEMETAQSGDTTTTTYPYRAVVMATVEQLTQSYIAEKYAEALSGATVDVIREIRTGESTFCVVHHEDTGILWVLPELHLRKCAM